VPPAQDHRFFGKYRGTVTSNEDPKHLGRLKVKVPEVLGDVESGWALPHVPYAADGAGSHMVPPAEAGVWIEFEAGEPSRPIWTGCWWKSDQLPKTEAGSAATPAVKIVRSAEGLMMSLDDDGKTVVVSDENGDNMVKIDVQGGQVTVKASTKVVVDASAVELVKDAGHKLVHGDSLLTFLNTLVSTFNSHTHVGQIAPPGVAGGPVTPMPPTSPASPPQQTMLSQKVKTG
jgi:uncharacterized protein involved in type VI secretion and phage assembly